jgi:hypothetical protein
MESEDNTILYILLSFLVAGMIIMIIIFTRDTETVRQALNKRCPVDPNAGDKINVGNGATREHYLFSGCTASRTCDLPKSKIDPISNSILNQKEHCGAWDANSTGYYYNPSNGWKKGR